MFRLSHYLHQLVHPTPLRQRKGPVRPVVIWNLTRRCNLLCRHCYAVAADRHFPGELTSEEAMATLEDLAAYRIPALILSGGEPLYRHDVFELAERAKALGVYTALSSNGTPIQGETADRVAEIGFDYVGISLDGIGETNDWFRGREGAFEEALNGVRACVERGVKVGLRFTMTEDNARQLPALLQLAEDEGVQKFYLSHLVYAGRGNKHRGEDTDWSLTRDSVALLIERAWAAETESRPLEIVTGNNDADAVSLLHWAAERFPAERVEHLRRHLAAWGGNSSGLGVANIDNLGRVHPDTYWSDFTMGNVRERPFSAIWDDASHPVVAGLRQRPRPVEGRCGRCPYLDVCGGNTRVRALQLTGDPWAEDPACYLDDEALGMPSLDPRLELRPFHGKRHDPAHRFV